MFTIDELSIIRLYGDEAADRVAVIRALESCQMFINDEYVWQLVSGLIQKLDALTDEAFAGLDLSDTLATDF